MAVIIGDTINIGETGLTTKPLDNRDQFDTLSEMISLTKYKVDLGHISWCKENSKQYIFRSDLDKTEELGYWREYLEIADGEQIESLFNEP